MKQYLPSLLFLVYGAAIIGLSTSIAKEMEIENVSDRFYKSQQTMLSVGSMSLAFGLILAVLNYYNMLSNKYCMMVCLGLGALLTVMLLACVIVMFNESKELKDSRLHKLVISSLTLALVVLVAHLPLGWMARKSSASYESSTMCPM